MKARYGIIILTFLLVAGFSLFYAKPDRSASNQFGYQDINSQEAQTILKNPDTFVLDVHTPEQTHLPQTDQFIPFDQIETDQSRLPEDKKTPILVYCRSGSMSQTASQTLINLGYQTVYNLAGGLDAYRQEIEEISLTPPTQPLGQVIYGDIAQTEFTLTNFTPTPVTIMRVSTSCGCTQARASQEAVDPYEETTITVTFDPAVHQDNTDLGNITRTIYIETNHPQFTKLTAEITANVIKKEGV